MLAGFWGAVGGKLADRWAAVAGPAVVFWAGGILAWVYAGPGWERLSRITDWLNKQEAGAQIAALLGGLVVVVASALVVQRVTTPVLRLLEGYWPRWAGGLTGRLRERARKNAEADDASWQQLQAEFEKPAKVEQRARQLSELAELEQRRQHRPSVPERLLPTRIGNILRAAETRPYDNYGLEAVVVWPRLWLVLPDSVRQELSTARASLDSSVAAVIWALGFCAFTPLAWWAAPVGAGIAVMGWRWWVPNRAEVFADLVEATYDLYRGTLYRQLRWPLPTSPADEQQAGENLTKYLLRGSDAPEPEFTSS
jgi:hypothetical protein